MPTMYLLILIVMNCLVSIEPAIWNTQIALVPKVIYMIYLLLFFVCESFNYHYPIEIREH